MTYVKYYINKILLNQIYIINLLLKTYPSLEPNFIKEIYESTNHDLQVTKIFLEENYSDKKVD